jgi:hypothetical protein
LQPAQPLVRRYSSTATLHLHLILARQPDSQPALLQLVLVCLWRPTRPVLVLLLMRQSLRPRSHTAGSVPQKPSPRLVWQQLLLSPQLAVAQH